MAIAVADTANAIPAISTQNGFALGGYDTVAYWKENKAVMGSSAFSFSWKGANWLFSSQANRDLFVTDPGKYAPQYGGQCAVCLAGGTQGIGAGDIWTIYKGKLYLFLNSRLRDSFLLRQEFYIDKANYWWPRRVDK